MSEAFTGGLVVSLRRGVASRGFTQVAQSEPLSLAEALALAQKPTRAEALFAARLFAKHGSGPAGKVRALRATVN